MLSDRQPYACIPWVRLFISTSPGSGGKSMAHSTDLRSSQRCAKSSVLQHLPRHEVNLSHSQVKVIPANLSPFSFVSRLRGSRRNPAQSPRKIDRKKRTEKKKEKTTIEKKQKKQKKNIKKHQKKKKKGKMRPTRTRKPPDRDSALERAREEEVNRQEEATRRRNEEQRVREENNRLERLEQAETLRVAAAALRELGRQADIEARANAAAERELQRLAAAAEREAQMAFLREAREEAAAVLQAERAARAHVRRAAIAAGGREALAAEVERVVLLMQQSGAVVNDTDWHVVNENDTTNAVLATCKLIYSVMDLEATISPGQNLKDPALLAALLAYIKSQVPTMEEQEVLNREYVKEVSAFSRPVSCSACDAIGQKDKYTYVPLSSVGVRYLLTRTDASLFLHREKRILDMLSDPIFIESMTLTTSGTATTTTTTAATAGVATAVTTTTSGAVITPGATSSATRSMTPCPFISLILRMTVWCCPTPTVPSVFFLALTLTTTMTTTTATLPLATTTTTLATVLLCLLVTSLPSTSSHLGNWNLQG
jgi:hypothetical protein